MQRKGQCDAFVSCKINCSNLYRFRVTASYLSKVADYNPSHLHLVPLLGETPFAEIFGIKS